MRAAPFDLAALITDPARAVEVPPEAIASVLTEVGGQEARLGTVKAILAARLASAPPANGAGEHDLVEDVHEVARIARHSVSWVRKNGHTLPGFRQPGGMGTRVGWSRRALEAWASGTP
jgi:hypothetical protein